MTILNQSLSFLSLILVFLSFEPSESKQIVKVGVVLDLDSYVGRIANRCMSMALSDFYAVNSNYRTRLKILTEDSQNDVVLAASAALDLMKNEEVQAIIGPQKSTQAKFAIDLGGKANVPVISFSASSPSLSTTENKFFVRSAQDDSFQVEALASIVQAYGWREIILIYEDTDYGTGIIPYLNDALQEVGTRVVHRSAIPLNSNDSEISIKLNNLKTNRTTIFLVHMTATLGSKLFVQAKKAGMMSEGYAWIVTKVLSALFHPVDYEKDTASMQGVLGLRPHVPNSRKLEQFKLRWKIKPSELNLFGLWAYDTVWAVAMAVENSGVENSSYLKPNTSNSRVDLAAIGTSEMGPKLLNTLLDTRFEGLSGNFHLVERQLEPSAFEIYNVIGNNYESIIGYWTKKDGLLSELNDNGQAKNSASRKLKTPIWPGNTVEQPRKLKIGVPVREGFTEFVKVEQQPNNKTKISGFSPEVFLAVVEVLEIPLPYEFVPFQINGKSAGSYNELVYKIEEQVFDAVVGDITIVADRSTYVDFTLPYSESGVSMVVLLKDDERKNFWIFLKPLSLNLWLTTGAAFIFTGLVVWVLEHRINTEFRGPPQNQLGTIFWFSFSTLVFAHRERVMNNLSRFVLIIWIFVVLILTQSYTASLTSMLTVQRLQPSFTDVKEIQEHGYSVGYQKGSFVKGFLTKQLNFDETKLKPYSSEGYHEALSSGEVAAIFDEIPYIKLFLTRYCSRYMMVGPTYRTDGFGFAFPKGSPLVSYVSRAILNVTEDKDKMEAIEKNTIGSRATCEGTQGSTLSSDSLSVYSFGGLFMITGIASTFSLVLYIFNYVHLHWPELINHHPQRSFHSKIIHLMKHFDQKDLSFYSFRNEIHKFRVNPISSPEVNATSFVVDDVQNQSRNSSERVENVVRDDGDEIDSSVHGDTSTDTPNTS